MVSDGARTFDVGGIDVARTLRTVGVYGGDPTFRRSEREFTKAVLTPDGPGTLRLRWDASGEVLADAWGTGSGWLLDRAPSWVGLRDDVAGFDPDRHPRVAEWWRRHGNVRLASIGVVWQELVLVLLGQRVTTEEAVRSWNRMCRTWGVPAPGPCEVWMPPSPAEVARLSYLDLHRVNVDRRRAEAILLAAQRADRLEEAAGMDAPAAIERLLALPGLGAWTATATVVATHGDPDTIVLRDYGMPTLVNYAFTGDARRLLPDEGGDEIMCRHLEPWRGHRQRVIRLMFAAGVSVPRRAPRSYNPDIRRL